MEEDKTRKPTVVEVEATAIVNCSIHHLMRLHCNQIRNNWDRKGKLMRGTFLTGISRNNNPIQLMSH